MPYCYETVCAKKQEKSQSRASERQYEYLFDVGKGEILD